MLGGWLWRRRSECVGDGNGSGGIGMVDVATLREVLVMVVLVVVHGRRDVGENDKIAEVMMALLYHLVKVVLKKHHYLTTFHITRFLGL